MADFLRLNVADGDASPKTVASYLTEVRQRSGDFTPPPCREGYGPTTRPKV
jgi:hypothetical protein